MRRTARLRGAVIGTGYSASHQLQAWADIDTVDIVAIAGRDRGRTAARASEFGVPTAYDDYRKMLASETLDFVDIATPPDTHEVFVSAAAARGVHVLCQKPAAHDLATMRRMIDVTESSGVVLGINENGRFQPWCRYIQRQLHDGRLGEVTSASFSSRGRWSLPYPTSDEQAFFIDMPRLIVFELGVHFLDISRYLFGPAVSIYAVTRHVSPHVVGEDAALIVVVHATTTVTLDLSWAHHPTWMGSGLGWAEVQLSGTSASLRLTPDGSLRVVNDEGTRVVTIDGDPMRDGYRAAQADFAAALQARRDPETSARDQLATMELVFGAYESARTDAVYHVGHDVVNLA